MKIVSFNCGGLRSNGEYLKLLLDEYDVVCVQETLLCDIDNSFLANFTDQFDYDYQSATRPSDSFVGRSSGGLATYWRSSYQYDSVTTNYKSNRLLSVTFSISQVNYTFINC